MRDSSHRLANHQQDDVEVEADERESEETKFAGGAAPVANTAGTAALAYEEDANERELKQKVGKLVQTKFAGDYKKAFSHYGADGNVSKGDLVKLLSDAGVGNGLTRGVWASKIIENLDTNGDGAIEWGEFETVFRAHA